jgi:hypothetical protein
MVTLQKEQLKEIEEGIADDIKTLSDTPRKTIFCIILGSIAIAFLASINGMDSEWARVIAPSLITVNGLILGFAVLGVTNLSDKDFVKATHESLIRQHMRELFMRLSKIQEVEKTERDRLIKNEFALVTGKTYFSEGVIHAVFKNQIFFLLVSLGLSFCIFGVNTTYAFLSLQWLFFILVLYLAIAFLLIAAYKLYQSFFGLLNRASIVYTRFDKELIETILDEKAAEEKLLKEKKG